MRQILFFTLIFLSFNTQAGLIDLNAGMSAIYGKDEREFIKNSAEKKILTLSKSVALIVSADAVAKKGLASSLITAPLLSDESGLNICKDEKFSIHHSLTSCTGFLIASDKLVSAGHCFMSESDCADKKIIFSVLTENEVTDGYKVSRSNVYECKKILKSAIDGQSDYAVIQLSKKVSGRAPLKLRTTGELAVNDTIFMIGHPLGLPQILSKNAMVTNTAGEHQFISNLDSFEGNSGSPVFNTKTLEVEGILVNGQEDLLEDSANSCYRYQKYDQNAKAYGEGINRISDIL